MELTKRMIEKIQQGLITKTELAKRLGIARVTLNTRLEKSNWKKSELYLLSKI